MWVSGVDPFARDGHAHRQDRQLGSQLRAHWSASSSRVLAWCFSLSIEGEPGQVLLLLSLTR